MRTDFKSFIDYYKSKTQFSTAMIARILGMKEQSLRNKMSRNPDITLKEVLRLLAYVNGNISIKIPIGEDYV